MKKILTRLTALIMVVVTAFILVGCGKDATFEVKNAYVVIDINPSIEIVTNEDGKVLRVTALNEDAQVLLVDVDLKGKTFEEAVDAIIELAKELGYIDQLDENAILFTVEAEEERTVEELIKFLQEKVNKFKDKHKLRIECLIEQLSKDPNLVEEARDLDLSVNKLALIKAAIEINPELTIEEARKFPIKDLLKIIADSREDADGIVNDENLAEYYKNKKLMASKITLKEVELLNEFIQSAEEDLFTSILEGTEISVETVKSLYQEYFDAIKAATDNFNDEGEAPDTSEEEKILLELIETLLEEKETLEQSIQDLLREFANIDRRLPNFKELKDQVQNQIREFQHERKEIMDQIREVTRELRDQFKKQLQENRGGNINSNHNELLRELREIRKEFEAKFEEIGIDLVKFERHFIDYIRDQIEDARTQIKEEFEAMKEMLKERSKEAKEQLRERKNQLKDLFR